MVTAAVQGEFVELLALDGVVERRVLRFQDRGGALDGHDLHEVADFELEVDPEAVAAVDLHAGADRLLEAVRLDRNLVRADLQRTDYVDAALVGRRDEGDVRARLASVHARAGNHGSGGVRDRSGDGALILLSERRQACHGGDDQEGQESAVISHSSSSPSEWLATPRRTAHTPRRSTPLLSLKEYNPSRQVAVRYLSPRAGS